MQKWSGEGFWTRVFSKGEMADAIKTLDQKFMDEWKTFQVSTDILSTCARSSHVMLDVDIPCSTKYWNNVDYHSAAGADCEGI